MTEKELARFNRGNELKNDIENLECEIENIEDDFQPPYTYAVCDIKLSCVIDDRMVEMTLDLDDLNDFVELLLQKRKDRLKSLKNEFKKL